MKKPQRRPWFDDRSRALDRFGLLLGVTIASIVILMVIDIGPGSTRDEGRWESVLASALVGATLLLALRASGLATRLIRFADIIVIGIVVVLGGLAVAASFTDVVPPPNDAAPAFVVVLAVVAPLAVIRRLVQHRVVTRGTLLGAISGYLLIPIAFFYLFIASSSLTRTAFFGDPEPTTTYMYFSLATITTTGYGDFTAATELGRLLSMAEAVTGQIYLVTFVAMLVGLFIAGRSTLKQGFDGAGQPGAERGERPDPQP